MGLTPLSAARVDLNRVDGVVKLADQLRLLLSGGTTLSWQELFHIADDVFQGTQGQGAYSVQDAYEAIQVAVNRMMAGRPDLHRVDPEQALAEIAAIFDRLPTQSVRTSEQQTHQQFSTPPGYAYLATWAAGILPDMVCLEPSEGTGSITAFAIAAGARVIGNEISPRRSALAGSVGPHLASLTENADHIASILAKRDLPRPRVVVMNPPFSSTAGRTRSPDPFLAAKHVSQALDALQPGGRLVAIVSGGMAVNSTRYAAWWRSLRAVHTLRANIQVPGSVYHAYGTDVDTRLIIIDKPAVGQGPETSAPLITTVGGLPELVQALKPLRRAQDSGWLNVADADEGEAYAIYRPSIAFPGAHQHPTDLVESQAMASVKAPATTYLPDLPAEVVSDGRLSLAQLEQIIRAGQAHEVMLPDGKRMGYFVGDGTGVGKGREIAGMMLDNFRRGREKALWISKSGKLVHDARRDWVALGGKAEQVFTVRGTKATDRLRPSTGIAFMTYATLRTGANIQSALAANVEPRGRVQQIVDWLGQDFDGLIAFDESHAMGNAVELKGRRGKKLASAQALTGLLLQAALPRARVVYVSATGATEVANLSYAARLGLWGPGTAFADIFDFVNKIQGAGLAAMEMVARDLKATGRYLARSISFRGVSYDRLVQDLTPDQVEIYNELASAWQIVLRNVQVALELTAASSSRHAKSAAMSAFWGGHQRFFNQVLTGMQMPALLSAIQRDLAAGHAVVVQLVNTQEAALKRALAARAAHAGDPDEVDLADLDVTPREMLLQYLQRFPTVQHEKVTDDDGNTTAQPVVDSQGNLVENVKALAMRDDLLSKLIQIRTPDGPLEQLLTAFGPDQIAEVTGRTMRVVDRQQADGTWKTVREARSEVKASAEAAEFQADRRRILVFSDAGGTGQSYHADRLVANQRLRRHYVLQPGWRADNALQGLGRDHRTNQVQPPEFILVTTNLKAQKRFISSIARRLDQLGALTKGQRQAGSGGLFSAADNLESLYAENAMEAFVRDLVAGKVEGMTRQEFEYQTGLEIVDADGRISVPAIPTFLNRLLSLTTNLQDLVFEAFQIRLDRIVQQAADDGVLDIGLETLKADRVEEVSSRVVHTDQRTGAQTTYHELRVFIRNVMLSWEKAVELARRRADDDFKVYRHERSGKVFIVLPAGTMTTSGGKVVPAVQRIGITGAAARETEYAFERRGYWESLYGEEERRKAWDAEVATAPEFQESARHLISGALLPVWARLPQDHVRVERALPLGGVPILGRVIPPDQLDSTLSNLGVEAATSPVELLSAVQAGATAIFANGWRMVGAKVGNEGRIELQGKTPLSRELEMWRPSLESMGVICEYRNYNWRFFVPTGAGGPEVLARVLEGRPVTRLLSSGVETTAAA